MIFEKKKEIPEDERATLHAEEMVGLPEGDKYEDDDPFAGKDGVEVTYNLRAEEVKKCLLLLQKEQIFTRNLIYTALLSVIFVLYLVSVIQNPSYTMGMITLALCAGVIALIWMMAWRYRTAQAKAVSSVKEDFNMTVFDTGILVHQENGDFRALFSEKGFRVRELDDVFLLDLNKQRVYVLPKRCMEEETAETLRQRFQGNLYEGKKSFFSKEKG